MQKNMKYAGNVQFCINSYKKKWWLNLGGKVNTNLSEGKTYNQNVLVEKYVGHSLLNVLNLINVPTVHKNKLDQGIMPVNNCDDL